MNMVAACFAQPDLGGARHIVIPVQGFENGMMGIDQSITHLIIPCAVRMIRQNQL